MRNDYLKIGMVLFICMVNYASSYGQISIKGTLTNDCKEDSIFILEHDGIALKKIQSAVLVKKGKKASFSFRFKKLEKGFYFLGVRQNNIKELILGDEKKVTVKGSCNQLRRVVVESPTNTYYRQVANQINQLDRQNNEQIQLFRNAKGDQNKIKVVIQNMANIDAARKKLLQDARIKNPFIGNFVGLHTYLSYHNNRGKYRNEVEYFGNEYFKQVNLADPHFNRIPFLYNKVMQYTQTLSQLNQPPKILEAFANRWLSMIPKGSRTHKMFLASTMNAFLQKQKTELFVKYATEYLKYFKNENADVTANITQQIRQVSLFAVGGIPPDIVQTTPEGDSLNLYDLRGKVVLVDFWASWCRPCRKANPEVVALYQKYKDKGFDVLGISLDRKKERWLKAIEQDKLTWHHVSDLKGWKNAAALLYGVRSIPQTFLLDKEGRILAHNLKGPDLANKLKQIFGE